MTEYPTWKAQPETTNTVRRPRGWIGLLVVLAVLTVPLACMGFAVPLDILVAVFFGWAFFLWRVVPEVTVSWPGLATATVALGAFAVGLHLLLRRLPLPGPSDSETCPWRPRWTAALVAVVVVMFVAGISVVGAIHQAAWLVTSGERVTATSGEAAQRTASRNNLREIGRAVHDYHDVNASFPPGGLFSDGLPLHGWETHLLPWLDAAPLGDRIDMTRAWIDPVHADVFRTRMHVFENPMMNRRRGEQDPFVNTAGYALSHYAANRHLFWPNSATRIGEITDGTSNTILAGEVNANFRPWGDPVNWRDPGDGINQSPDGFGSPFTGGAHFLLCDGSHHFISDKIDPVVFQALGTPADGEPVAKF